jgi:nitroimidazol reductase NimA-like FMN-containing flavoprotein (pyridoxamine 5'-phosphate oxidase superfamily)/ribosomal protein S18 acetylase RimI-like enzyme
MRRQERSGSVELAEALFRGAGVVRLASTREDGAPVLRALNAVVVDLPDGAWAVAWHGAPDGEKVGCLGREAVLQVDEVVASIPSWFTARERACPATTWYRSAQVRGRVEAVEGAADKARVLDALMRRFQPEGRHRPITATEPMYTAAIANLGVAWVRPAEVSAKQSLGWDKAEEVRQTVLRRLWERGTDEDLRALKLALGSPPEVWPAWLAADGRADDGADRPREALGASECAVAGLRLDPCVDAEEALPLLVGQPWNQHKSPDAVRAAWRASAAQVGARVDGRLIACARAVSDREKFAYVADVAVAEPWQRRGVGTAVMGLLLDHAAVRGADKVVLGTRTAEGVYARIGFTTFARTDGVAWMWRRPAR